jgi:hypothetical protein
MKVFVANARRRRQDIGRNGAPNGLALTGVDRDERKYRTRKAVTQRSTSVSAELDGGYSIVAKSAAVRDSSGDSCDNSGCAQIQLARNASSQG